jgi:hypothetical protein
MKKPMVGVVIDASLALFAFFLGVCFFPVFFGGIHCSEVNKNVKPMTLREKTKKIRYVGRKK